MRYSTKRRVLMKVGFVRVASVERVLRYERKSSRSTVVSSHFTQRRFPKITKQRQARSPSEQTP
jgi:hypothetical protein